MDERPLPESGISSAASRSWIATASDSEIVRRSLRVAAVVGTLLVTINYSDRALAGALVPADWAKVLLTYCVPYGVSTYASVQATRAELSRAGSVRE